MLPMALLLGGLLGGALAALRAEPLMRAAQTALRRPGLADAAACGRAPAPGTCAAERRTAARRWLFGAMFLAGYLPGIWLGRGGDNAVWGSSWRPITQAAPKV